MTIVDHIEADAAKEGVIGQTKVIHVPLDAAEQSQNTSEFSAFFQNDAIGMYQSCPTGKMLRSNPALVNLNGYSSEEEHVGSVNDIASEWYVDPGRRDIFCRRMAEQGRVVDFVSEIYCHRTRQRLWISETAWMVCGFFLNLCGSSAVSENIAMGGHAEEIEMVARPRG